MAQAMKIRQCGMKMGLVYDVCVSTIIGLRLNQACVCFVLSYSRTAPPHDNLDNNAICHPLRCRQNKCCAVYIPIAPSPIDVSIIIFHDSIFKQTVENRKSIDDHPPTTFTQRTNDDQFLFLSSDIAATQVAAFV